MVTDFQNSFTVRVRLRNDCVTHWSLRIPSHLKRVATLPCETLMFKIDLISTLITPVALWAYKQDYWYLQTSEVILLNTLRYHIIVTLLAKLSGAVYCNRSWLWVCLCLCVCLCASILTKLLIKFWPSCAPGKGSATEHFLAPPYYSQCAVFASLWVLFG